MAHCGNTETEIKLAVADADNARKMLEDAGFRISKPRVFEKNILFDTSERTLRSRGQALRVREAGGRGILTLKGRAVGGRHKVREETEVDVSDAPAACAILSRLGFVPAFHYEKYRTEFAEQDSAGVAMLDETPIGVFLELEGEPDWIDAVAARLGFSHSDYVTASYVSLYFQFREATPEAPADMVFSD